MIPVHEFLYTTSHSSFAQRLQETALAEDMAACLRHPQFLPATTFMDPKQYIQEPVQLRTSWGHTWNITNCISASLIHMMTYIGLNSIGQSAKHLENASVTDFDAMWLNVDMRFWGLAGLLDRPGESGTVARHFGMFNPTDPRRPTGAKSLLENLRQKQKALQLVDSSKVKPIIVTLPEEQKPDARVTSGHTYVVENQESRSKEKVKTRKEDGQAQVSPPPGRTLFEDEEDAADFPETLPTEYKLGKKVMKVLTDVKQCVTFSHSIFTGLPPSPRRR